MEHYRGGSLCFRDFESHFFGLGLKTWWVCAYVCGRKALRARDLFALRWKIMKLLDFGRNGIRLSGLGHRGFGGSLPMRFAFWGKP